MSAWWWVLIWAVLVLAALGGLAMIGLSLWRRVKLLLRELSAASDRFAEISAKLEVAAQRPEPEQPAVFSDPSELRQERFRAHRSGKPVARPVSGSAGQSGYRVR